MPSIVLEPPHEVSNIDVPLCVDLDGTLVRTDLLYESIIALVKQCWWALLLIPFWLCRGRSHLKHQLAQRTSLRAATLPYRNELVSWLKKEKAAGRKLVLATGSHATIATAVNKHLDLFHEVIATGEQQNLTGRAKARELATRFGAHGFDYAGDSRADEAVWSLSRERIGAGKRCKSGTFDRVFPDTAGGGLKALVRALRPKHWIKNLLVFVAVITSHELFRIELLARCAVAFLAFSLTASAVYIFNDLVDLDSDRRHPIKCRRPFASGELRVSTGLIVGPMLFIAGISLCALLGTQCLAVLAAYFLLTIFYSFFLKRKLLADVFMLAVLYTMRIVEGAAASRLRCTMWLLAFSIFQFLSLAFLKRSAELARQLKKCHGAAAGRAYFTWDLSQVNAFGVAAGFVSSLVLGLYIGSSQVLYLYRQPKWLWLLLPLHLYWISRVWILSHRGAMDEDPIVFAAGDRVTWMSAVITTAVLALASFGGIVIPGVSL